MLFVVWNGLVSGGDLCEVGASLRGSVPAADGAELPFHCHPQRHGTRREVGPSLNTVLKEQKMFSFESSGFKVRNVLSYSV